MGSSSILDVNKKTARFSIIINRLAVGVWVGRNNHKPIGKKEAGSRAALPIWIEFMKKAPLQIPPEQNP
ncbi:MAG: hypothetical protein FP829_00635 [Nitrospirae bacterium]|nr:hypothetical protein [Nitrospirota bacterium]